MSEKGTYRMDETLISNKETYHDDLEDWDEIPQNSSALKKVLLVMGICSLLIISIYIGRNWFNSFFSPESVEVTVNCVNEVSYSTSIAYTEASSRFTTTAQLPMDVSYWKNGEYKKATYSIILAKEYGDTEKSSLRKAQERIDGVDLSQYQKDTTMHLFLNKNGDLTKEKENRGIKRYVYIKLIEVVIFLLSVVVFRPYYKKAKEIFHL